MKVISSTPACGRHVPGLKTNSTTGDVFVDNLDLATTLVFWAIISQKSNSLVSFMKWQCFSFILLLLLMIVYLFYINSFFEKQQVYSKYIVNAQ